MIVQKLVYEEEERNIADEAKEGNSIRYRVVEVIESVAEAADDLSGDEFMHKKEKDLKKTAQQERGDPPLIT